MAMGIPVITNSGVGDVQEIVEKYKSGFVLKELNEKNYRYITERLVTDDFDKFKIREGAKEFYSLENAVQKYSEVYSNIFAKG